MVGRVDLEHTTIANLPIVLLALHECFVVEIADNRIALHVQIALRADVAGVRFLGADAALRSAIAEESGLRPVEILARQGIRMEFQTGCQRKIGVSHAGLSYLRADFISGVASRIIGFHDVVFLIRDRSSRRCLRARCHRR